VTERLYYADPYLTEFDAVVGSIELHAGARPALLNRTAFYPTSAASRTTPGAWTTCR